MRYLQAGPKQAVGSKNMFCLNQDVQCNEKNNISPQKISPASGSFASDSIFPAHF